MKLALIRHGPTAWNAEKRIQGRTDVPLSQAGRATVAQWRVPIDVKAYQVLVSPLTRARETAELLGLRGTRIEPALAERSWGSWEGERLPELRSRYGSDMKNWEARGLDFRAPQGESSRDLQARLMPLLVRLAADATDTLAVTHRGVIRAIYALATGWDMRDKPPEALHDGCLQLFELTGDGLPVVSALNRPLGDGARAEGS
ncbi:histidine phosphatase family protein [Rhodovibrio salinarum]|uniref:Histidine phosphatase family protein n=1 Tax=Rhodovibrio salinarum TaxID=1087 RepID=A0A934QHY8_9PROT|nr:histidine phosphatase family protein [Rhodovibrio salinarum]MBK1696840.1 histidine phosphatase family protein [Rhodovibrio salinarum]